MSIMTGIAVSQTGTDHQDVQHEFRAIMNASRRASISNMTTFTGQGSDASRISLLWTSTKLSKSF
jgi:hypothetical protein